MRDGWVCLETDQARPAEAMDVSSLLARICELRATPEPLPASRSKDNADGFEILDDDSKAWAQLFERFFVKVRPHGVVS